MTNDIKFKKNKTYTDDVKKQNDFFCKNLKHLTLHHFSKSEEYKKFLIKATITLK